MSAITTRELVEQTMDPIAVGEWQLVTEQSGQMLPQCRAVGAGGSACSRCTTARRTATSVASLVGEHEADTM